jgi:multidrug efflux pump subunit AcrB
MTDRRFITRMIEKIVEYFSKKHLFTNLVVLGVFAGAALFWNSTNKEELPNIELDFIRINTTYPGATAEEVEFFITREIEEKIEGIEGIDEISSTSSQGSSSIIVTLLADNPDRDDVVTEIKDSVNRARLPDDLPNDPAFREFKSSQKAIIDIVLRHKSADILDDNQRQRIQNYADTLENRLLRMPEVSDVSVYNYLDRYIAIEVRPEKMSRYRLSINDITTAIRKSNIKVPVGALDDEESTGIRLDGELDSIEKLRETQVQTGFEGNSIILSDVADIDWKFKEQSDIRKVNGTEAVRMTVTKKASVGILDAIDALVEELDEFEKTVLANSEYDITTLDDESQDVRNRLSLIMMNGLFGFVLILVILFVFMDARSGIWVALGIPFSLGFTMIFASLLGNTINNITLAGVIIVMGMVVDDAIVVAENVARLRHQGVPPGEAVVKGTSLVLMPIVASIATTCVAFIPLFFWEGRFGILVGFIPPIIFLMLGGSLFEALIILPSHLKFKFPRWARTVASLGLYPVIERYYQKRFPRKSTPKKSKGHWFFHVEERYGRLMEILLRWRPVVFGVFILLMVYAGWVFTSKMRYVMFPREETTSLFLEGETPEGTLKYETERLVRDVEAIFDPYLGNEVTGYETRIARGRRGGAARENRFTISIEIVNRDERKKSSNQLQKEWQEEINNLDGFEEIRFSRSRWGQSSGSAVDILIQEQNDASRDAIANDILQWLSRMPAVENPELERILMKQQYILTIDKKLAARLGISLDTIGSTMRTVLEGTNIYDIVTNGEEYEVELSVRGTAKETIEGVLQTPIQNKTGYLVPLGTIVSWVKTNAPDSIKRQDGKRTRHVYADLRQTDSEREEESVQEEMLDLPKYMTPLQVAEHLEAELFPVLYTKYPTADISFSGEIQDTRESSGNFITAIILVLVFIYLILALTLNSLSKPFIIMLSIAFGCVGIIIALQLHGMLVFGFFSAVGALGLAGVVVNDSIVMLAKLEKEYNNMEQSDTPAHRTAMIAKTRLRAVLLTTVTTVAGLLPTAYGIFGYDSMLAEMMLTMAWGLVFGTLITLILVPSLYCTMKEVEMWIKKHRQAGDAA